MLNWVRQLYSVHLERAERDRLLVVVVPGAPQLAGLVPHLLDQRVVLDDHRVLHVAASGVRLPVRLRVPRAGHAARIEEDLEAGGDGARPSCKVDAVRVAVEAFAEDHPVEGTVELDVHSNACLLALDLGDIVNRLQVPIWLMTWMSWIWGWSASEPLAGQTSSSCTAWRLNPPSGRRWAWCGGQRIGDWYCTRETRTTELPI